jgi:23S rRNA (uridine2552-2'-O)-methyltransferase
VADAFDLSNAELSEGAPYDVVLSDMAPNTSGDKIQDRARSQALYLRALELSSQVGKKGGSFVGKIFMSEDFGAARQATLQAYGSVRVIRPAGTRSQSTELFIVGSGRR